MHTCEMITNNFDEKSMARQATSGCLKENVAKCVDVYKKSYLLLTMASVSELLSAKTDKFCIHNLSVNWLILLFYHRWFVE